ncbi:receptor-like protein 53 [Argentina anserina]|uniref:receptor-like protein 53 n=1 Tax=Argentina anserina TaxID=57926 RepID=UPI0021766137|nr:receptor-like protein 53 [Potentilla anserina]
METQLVELCLNAACESRDSVDKWRRQRRSLEHLPSQLADSLLRRLISRRLLFPSLLEVFKNSVEEIDLRGDNNVDAEWFAYIGAFRYLRSLNVSDCRKITSSAVWALAGMPSLRELDLSRCSKVNDSGIRHLLSLTTLEMLCISETGVSAKGVMLLSSLGNLSALDLGGLPVTDQAVSSLKVLTKLQYLDLWGSKISDKGAALLHMFPRLSFLNLAWTSVTKLPNWLSMECLNMSHCTINSLLEGDSGKAPLLKLILSGATFGEEIADFHYIETTLLTFLDLSKSTIQDFSFLSHLTALVHLDLSSTVIGDDSLELIACIGVNLKYLNLKKTKVSSAGVGILSGHVPNLEVFSISHTSVDDVTISYIGMMPSVKDVDLSNTNIKGVIYQAEPVTEPDPEPESELELESDSVLSLSALQGLRHLQRLNLADTQVTDAALYPLTSFPELSHLSLKSASLTDFSFNYVSSISKLKSVCIYDGVLTNSGLNSFKPPASLRMMDLRGCWLLTEDAITSFSKTHPQIELWHDLVHISRSDQTFSNTTPFPRSTLKTSRVKKHESIPMLECFLDQRLKYSREELLSMQFSSVSLAAHIDRDIGICNTESD